jgi:DDE superfamily endonuclease
VLQYHFNWKTLSAMAGVTWLELLLSTLSRRHQKSASGRVPPTSDAASAGQTADHLGRPAQSSQATWYGTLSANSAVGYGLEFLPAYAPELNPVEYLWSHWKQHELPNFCPSTFTQLSLHARRALKRMRQRPLW